MDKQLRAGVVFHLTGRHADGLAVEPVIAALCPALMACYRGLESLRYDFPVILGGSGGEYVQSLFDDHFRDRRDNSLYIWTLFNLTAWYDYWIDRRTH